MMNNKMKVNDIISYINDLKEEASKAIYDSIRMLNNKNLTSSEYNQYALALTRAQSQLATCNRLLDVINNC